MLRIFAGGLVYTSTRPDNNAFQRVHCNILETWRICKSGVIASLEVFGKCCNLCGWLCRPLFLPLVSRTNLTGSKQAWKPGQPLGYRPPASQYWTKFSQVSFLVYFSVCPRSMYVSICSAICLQKMLKNKIYRCFFHESFICILVLLSQNR